MVKVGPKPILWHIMKIYSSYGINDFVICAGYKEHMIREYFSNNSFDESWKVDIVDTGKDSMTGGRLARVYDYIKDEKDFCFTYGDGLADINIADSIEFHRNHGKLATITATYPPARFGALQIEDNQVISFLEKPKGDGRMINGGFFVLSPKVVDLIFGDLCIWEKEPLESLVKDRELMAYKHHSFWHPMDTLRDKNFLKDLWESGDAPWKNW
jgi:glucose-1-phosphate cytidylyltransferase